MITIECNKCQAEKICKYREDYMKLLEMLVLSLKNFDELNNSDFCGVSTRCQYYIPKSYMPKETVCVCRDDGKEFEI